MAAGRKLQAEIDKLLKKVEEGLEEFQNIWEGVHHASQASQREKFETELKAQIKKLQRDREQIKTWLGDKSIKDKNALSDARKKIETDMERFKEFERDAKTKTYSKEGLMKTDKVDPEQEERRRHRTWIQDSVSKLEVQIDELDADLEAYTGKKSSKASKDEGAVAHLKAMQESHRWHIVKLEQLLRKLDNDEVNLDELDDLKDSVDFYVDENSREPGEFQEFDTIYEEFKLEEVEDYMTKDKGKEKEEGEKDDTAGAEKGKDEVVHKEEPKPQESKPAKENSKNSSAKASPVMSGRAKPAPASKATEDGHEASTPAQKPWPPMVSVWQNPPPAASSAEKDAKAAPAVSPGPPPKPAPSLPPPMQPAPDRPPPPGQAPVLNTPPNQPPPKPAPQMQPPTQAPPQPPLPSPPVGSPPRPTGNAGGSATTASSTAQSGSAPSMPAPPPMPPPAPQDGGAAAASATPSAPAAGAGGGASGGEPPSTAPPPPPPPSLPPPPPSAAPAPAVIPAKKQPPVQQQGAGALNDRDPPHLPPPISGTGIGAGSRQAPKAPPPPSEAPPPPAEMPPPPPESGTAVGGSSSGDVAAARAFPNREGQSSAAFESGGLVPSLRPSETPVSSSHATADDSCGPLSPRRLQSLQLLSASHRNLPAPSDSRRSRKYVPRNPYVHMDAAGNAAYHMQPTRNYEDPAMFEKYDLDTLFFIFYYQQGSYQQHLAAKELKKLSWRYHTKYLTWFQRHEEPRMTAAEYERGAYVYFDHDSGWCQRIKSDFTFEYQFLEDEPV